MRADDSSPTQPSPNGRYADAAVDGFNQWLDALVAGGDGRTPCTPPGDAARLGETARRLQTLASRVDRHGASEAVMERTWEAIMAETLTLDAAPSAAPGDFTPAGHAAVERERHGQVTRPQRTGRERPGPRLWRSVRRWQPVVSTAGTLVLLFALIAGYAASRGALPPGGDGDGRSRLAAVGTPSLGASPAAVACTVEPLSKEDILRIDQFPPEFPPRSYTPIRQADVETAAAVLAVLREQRACEAQSSFHAYALGTERYVWETSSTYWRERVSASPVPGETRYDLVGGTVDRESIERVNVSIDRVIDEFIFHDGQVRPEITELAWWSTPQDEQVFEAGFQPEDVFVLADGRVAALWGDLTIPHEYGQSIYDVPTGFYRFAAFAQEGGQWRLDEEVMFMV